MMSDTKVDVDKTSVVDKGATGAPNVEYKSPPREEKISDVEIKVKSSLVEGTEGAVVVPKVEDDNKSLLEEVKVSSIKMSKVLEPPAFVSDDKSYAEYKVDLQRWSRICGIEKKVASRDGSLSPGWASVSY
jgi:hypothetical protein